MVSQISEVCSGPTGAVAGTYTGAFRVSSVARSGRPGPAPDALDRVAQLLEETLSLDVLCEGVLGWLAEITPCTQSALLLCDDGALGLALAARRGPGLSEDEVLWVAGAAGRALRGHGRLQVSDVNRSPQGGSIEERSGRMRAVLLLPLTVGGEAIGVLQLSDSAPGRFEAQSETLERFASVAARLIRHAQRLGRREGERARWERLAASRARVLDELEAEKQAFARRRALDALSVRLAERSADPTSAILANLDRAREYVDTLRETLPPLLGCAGASQDPRVRRALEAAEKAGLSELVEDFPQLLSDVSEGAEQLRGIGADFLAYALGGAHGLQWSSASELVAAALSVAQIGEKGAVEVRLDDLPALRCHRLELIRVLVDMLEAVASLSGTTSGVRMTGERRGERLHLEISSDGDWVSVFDQAADAEAHAALEIARAIVREQGGRLAVERFDDLTIASVTLPLDPG